VAWLLLVSHACGDASSGAHDGAATAADVASWCDAICEYRERCPDEDAEPGDASAQPCNDECSRELGAVAEAGLVQQRVARALGECARGLSCDGSDDVCVQQVAADLDLDVASPLVSTCLELQDECGGFSDDFCAYAATATSAGKARLDECFSAGCAAVGVCIEALAS
jgi:hypothetical protein